MNEAHIKGTVARTAAHADLLVLFNAPPPGYVTTLLSCAATGAVFCFGNWHAECLRKDARALAARHRAPTPPALSLPKASWLMQRALDRDPDALDRLETLLRKALVASMAKDPDIMSAASTEETLCGLMALAPWGRSPTFVSKTMRRMSLAESGWTLGDDIASAAPFTRH